MDSPELEYLKRMAERNAMFYVNTTLELAELKGMLEALIDVEYSIIIPPHDLDADGFHKEMLVKMETHMASHVEKATEFLRRLGLPIIESDSENN